MAAEIPKTTEVVAAFHHSSRTLPIAPELVFADALGPEVMALGGSALSIVVNGPVEREASDEVRSKLDEPLLGMKAYIRRELFVLGVYTVRQALVVGSEAMVPHLPNNLAVINNIKVQIAMHFSGLRLLRKPTPAYVATFCRDLSEVPIAAIFPRNVGRETPSVHDVMIRNAEALQRIPEEALPDIRTRAFEFAPLFREARRRIEQP